MNSSKTASRAEFFLTPLKLRKLFLSKKEKYPKNIGRIIDRLLSSLSRVFETLLYKQIMTFCTMNEVLTSLQKGFKPKTSCTRAILSITEFMRQTIEKKETGQPFFIDSQKASDTLDHRTLLRKIERLGIEEKFEI